MLENPKNHEVSISRGILHDVIPGVGGTWRVQVFSGQCVDEHPK